MFKLLTNNMAIYIRLTEFFYSIFDTHISMYLPCTLHNCLKSALRYKKYNSYFNAKNFNR